VPFGHGRMCSGHEIIKRHTVTLRWPRKRPSKGDGRGHWGRSSFEARGFAARTSGWRRSGPPM